MIYYFLFNSSCLYLHHKANKAKQNDYSLYFMKKSSCPICQNEMFYNPHYPDEVCKSCVGRATDGHGRYVKFYNRNLASGIIGFYADADGKEEYEQTTCYVSKQKCKVKEARFGGVVIELITQKDENSGKN